MLCFFLIKQQKTGCVTMLHSLQICLIYWVFALYRKGESLLSGKSFSEAVGLTEACKECNIACRIDLLAFIVYDFEALSGDIDLGNA